MRHLNTREKGYLIRAKLYPYGTARRLKSAPAKAIKKRSIRLNFSPSSRHRVHQYVHLRFSPERKYLIIKNIQNRLEARRSAIEIKGPGENLGPFFLPRIQPR